MKTQAFDPYDVSNFIINYCQKNSIKINNLKLNGIMSYIYYDSLHKYGNSVISCKPFRGKHFYKIEEVYSRFLHMGAEEIRAIPSDFDFMSILEDKDLRETKRLSDELVNEMSRVDSAIGDYIAKCIIRLNNESVFDLAGIIDDKVSKVGGL